MLLHTFQMLCPGCVAYGIPQAGRVHEALPDVAVVGLHTVFEHHEAMHPPALAIAVRADHRSMVVRSPCFVSTTNTASRVAGSVRLAFSLTTWCAPGFSCQLSPA